MLIKGDKRFSAFYARIYKRGNKSIEEIYQASKIFEGGITNLNWRQVKGKIAVNQNELSRIYDRLWLEYILENKYLIPILINSSGLSDIFGQKNHNCQALTLWKIRNLLIKKLNISQ